MKKSTWEALFRDALDDNLPCWISADTKANILEKAWQSDLSIPNNSFSQIAKVYAMGAGDAFRAFLEKISSHKHAKGGIQ